MRFSISGVVYSTTFIILLVLLIALLLISPADGIYQSRVNDQGWNIVFIAGVYLLTFVVGIFIYATRIYATHSHLASIPRSYIPIRKGDVGTSVRRLIVEGLERSALIAYQAHPRELPSNEQDAVEQPEARPADARPSQPLPSWGKIEHPGWSSPASPDLPGLQYEPVLLELPNIIEAKAVSLAPPDPLLAPRPSAAVPAGIDGPADGSLDSQMSSIAPQALPDPTAVLLLQRLPAMPPRAYLARLGALAMLPEPALAPAFLEPYERARFSGAPLTEHDFRALLAAFAALLRSLRPPDPACIADLAAAQLPPSSGITTPTSPSARPGSRALAAPSVSSSSAAGSVVHHKSQRVAPAAPPALGSSRPPGPLATATPIPSATAHPTPFLTPRPAYPASLSSGHAGDRSDDDDDEDDEGPDGVLRPSSSSGSERTAQTAWTRPSAGGGRRTPAAGTAPRPVRRRGKTFASAREMNASGTETTRAETLGGPSQGHRAAEEGVESGDSEASVVVRREASGRGTGLGLPVALLGPERPVGTDEGV